MKNDNIKLFNDNCYTKIKEIPNNSIDLIITDPPYDYSEGGWNFYHNAKAVKGIARSGLQGGGAFGNNNKQHFDEITNNVYENKKRKEYEELIKKTRKNKRNREVKNNCKHIRSKTKLQQSLFKQ